MTEKEAPTPASAISTDAASAPPPTASAAPAPDAAPPGPAVQMVAVPNLGDSMVKASQETGRLVVVSPPDLGDVQMRSGTPPDTTERTPAAPPPSEPKSEG